MRDYRDEKKKRKPEVRVCLYCGINTAKGGSLYCCKACERYDQEYREWLKPEKR